MKKYILLVLPVLFILSCSKKNDVNPAPVTGTVIINGSVYPTVTIGNQVWTTQNYSGPGAGEMNASVGDPVLNGNYYSSTDITLPAGWRIPTRADYNILLGNYSNVLNAGGDVQCDLTATEGLISKQGWAGISGTNATGFNAYSAGYYILGNGTNTNQITDKTNAAYYLTSTVYPSNDLDLAVNYYVEKFGNSPVSFNKVSYYSYITNIPIVLFQTPYASLRFVKDK